MKIRQTLILSLTAAVVVALLTPGSWARADESAAQFGIQSSCYAEASCLSEPYVISCQGEFNCSSQNDPGGYVECDGQRTDCAGSYCYAEADCDCPPDVSCEGDSTCSAQDDPGGYVQCDDDDPIYCSCPLDLDPPVVTECQDHGSSTDFTLEATASGGNGSYSFSWANATPTSGPTANPNGATSTIYYKRIRVRVTVTSGSESESNYIDLEPGCQICCP